MSAPQDRVNLANIISQAVGGWNQNAKTITNVADAIITAGWTPPADPCAWCGEPSNRTARHNDDKHYPSCGERTHGYQPHPHPTHCGCTYCNETN